MLTVVTLADLPKSAMVLGRPLFRGSSALGKEGEGGRALD